jgi:glycosyltransferase involved in cell wall biosynthesis
MMPEIGYGDLLVPRLMKITGWGCNKADVLIVQSEYQRKMTEKNLRLNRDTSVLSRRVEVEKFPYAERLITLPVNFLHIASYQPVKDQETLFRAFAKIANQVECRLTVVGHGFEVPAVKQMLIDLGIESKVKLTGEVRHEEIAGHFAKAHILLHTSHYESLCGVVQEAMASGVPVCGTNVGILSDLGEPFAVLVSPHDPDELANQTISLIHDVDRYHRQQKLARDYIIRHDADWAAKQYKDLFEKLINKQKSDI